MGLYQSTDKASISVPFKFSWTADSQEFSHLQVIKHIKGVLDLVHTIVTLHNIQSMPYPSLNGMPKQDFSTRP